MDHVVEFDKEMKTNIKVARKNLTIYNLISYDSLTAYQDILWLLGLALNILILFYYSTEQMENFALGSNNYKVTLAVDVISKVI